MLETTTTDSAIQKKEKPKSTKEKSPMKKIDQNAVKILAQLKERANKKDYGRPVLEKDILSFAVKLVTDEHLKELQSQTYSEMDRLTMAHMDYQRTHGKISMDQFIGKLLKGEIKPAANT